MKAEPYGQSMSRPILKRPTSSAVRAVLSEGIERFKVKALLSLDPQALSLRGREGLHLLSTPVKQAAKDGPQDREEGKDQGRAVSGIDDGPGSFLAGLRRLLPRGNKDRWARRLRKIESEAQAIGPRV